MARRAGGIGPMVLWGIIFGAIIGWCLADFDSLGLFAGGLVGLGAGFWLRSEIRKEVAAARAEFRETRLDPTPPTLPDQPVSSPARATAASVAVIRGNAAVDSVEAATTGTQSSEASAPATNPAASMVLTPAGPTIVDRAIIAARDWLFGGNTIVRTGLIILFIGLSFLARYAASAGLFPVELRLAVVAAAGVALLAIGFRKRDARPGFALALQGTGVAILYLTVFAGARLFDLMPMLPAFGIMILICVLGCALALLQNSQTLAVAAFAGGFAVPLLLGGKSDSPIALFSYYTMLNLAVLLIAQKRAWRLVNLIGFFATFGVATMWGVLNYDPAHYAVSQFFLIVSVLIYVTAAILYARNVPGRLGNVVDTTLLFGPALAGFGLQMGLVRQFEYGAAFSALGFAALYIVLAGETMRRGRESFRLLTECMIAIGVGFITLAIPLALGVEWTSSAWALEGAGAFWVGMRQARWMPRMFGLLLQIVAAFVFLGNLDGNVAALPLANSHFVGGILIALPVLVIAWWLRRPLPHSESPWAMAYARVEARLSIAAFMFGFLFWFLAMTLEICRALPPIEAGNPVIPVFSLNMQRLLALLALLASMWVSTRLGRMKDWPVATWPSRVSLLPLVSIFLAQVNTGDHILYTPDWAIWLLALGLHFHMLYVNDATAVASSNSALRMLYRATHVGTVWLLTAMFADCLAFWIDRGGLWQTSWAAIIFLVSAIVVLMGLVLWAGRATLRGGGEGLIWPLARHAMAYYWIAALPLAALIFLGTLLTAMFASGHAEPLPYLPLINPIDLTLLLALAALAIWRRMIVAAETPPPASDWIRGRGALIALAMLAFVIVNSMWLRIAHHLLGVAWDAEALLDNFVVQTGLAILWTLLALVLMLAAHRRMQRAIWLTGAGLLGLVVAKLILIDLSNAGGAARIVTFIVVGALMLVVGYFAPLPPRKAQAAAERVVQP